MRFLSALSLILLSHVASAETLREEYKRRTYNAEVESMMGILQVPRIDVEVSAGGLSTELEQALIVEVQRVEPALHYQGPAQTPKVAELWTSDDLSEGTIDFDFYFRSPKSPALICHAQGLLVQNDSWPDPANLNDPRCE